MGKKDLVGLVMAGGKGSRMGIQKEKPLIEIGGKTMIQHVAETLENMEEIDEIAIAVTDDTPETGEAAQNLSLRVLKTSGKGYHPDMREAIREINSREVLVISSDLPLVTGDILRAILSKFRKTEKPALSVFVPPDTLGELGLEPHQKYELKNRDVIPAGINLIETEHIEEPKIEQEDVILSEPELALNVNNEKRLKMAKRMLSGDFE